MRSTLDTKCRLCRTEGTKLFLKGARCLSSKCPIDKKGAVRPGMHGLKRTKKLSDFAIQLRAKQQAKRYYGGIMETQFRNYYEKAKLMKGLVGENLLSLLERRLDNAVFMAGLALSRAHARTSGPVPPRGRGDRRDRVPHRRGGPGQGQVPPALPATDVERLLPAPADQRSGPVQPRDVIPPPSPVEHK